MNIQAEKANIIEQFKGSHDNLVGIDIKLNLCYKNRDSMSTQIELYQGLVKLLLPSELFDYFEITNLVITDRSIAVFLDERDIKPTVYSGQKLSSKGFHPLLN